MALTWQIKRHEIFTINGVRCFIDADKRGHYRLNILDKGNIELPNKKLSASVRPEMDLRGIASLLEKFSVELRSDDPPPLTADDRESLDRIQHCLDTITDRNLRKHY